VIERPGAQVAETLKAWLAGAPPEPKIERITDEQQKRIFALMHEHGKSRDEVKAILDRHGFAASAEITTEKYDAICNEIAAKKSSEQ